MIRNSAVIATVAVAISLFAHLFGVTAVLRVPPVQPPEEPAAGDVSLGTGFEDVAETAPEPPEPEPAPAPAPEPPVEAVAEAPPVDMGTSLALVESANPQPTTTPGMGSAPAAPAETVTPVEPTASSVPEPQSANQPDAAAPSEAPSPEPGDTASNPPPPAAPVEPSPSVDVAALPLEAAPELPITPSLDLDAIPLAFEQAEPEDTLSLDATSAPVPEPEVVDEAGDPSGGTALAVRDSPRPPARPSAPDATGLDDGPQQILFPESPLTAYARDGNLDGWGMTTETGEGGNATVTNYAGEVLVRLNNAPGAPITSDATAQVVFEINPDGSLAWVEVINSTGTAEFDRAAETQVRNAAPFPRPPEGAQRRFSFKYRRDG